jgi:hypothetical protein
VDRAALDAAGELGIPRGGWCPRGRRAEDGIIPAAYPLTETPARHYAQRTAWNVRDADATLILTWGPASGGTRLTARICQARGKPHRVVDLADPASWAADAVADLRHWLRRVPPAGTINVAGPRESEAPGIHDKALAFLRDVLAGDAP